MIGFSQDIANARSQGIGAIVTITGVITNGDELGAIRYIEDGTAGLAIYDPIIMGAVSRGDEITVSGVLVDYQGLLEVHPVNSLTTNSSGNVVTPQLLTPLQIGESTESELVQINNVIFNNGGSIFTIGIHDFSSNGETGKVYIKAGNPLENSLIPTGIVTLIGVSSQHTFNFACPHSGFCPANDGYQILPRDSSDIFVPINGCTDSTSTNYNPNATVDDGSCFLSSFCENFDSYSNGTPIAETSSKWNTWGELTNGATTPFIDDANVVNNQFSSGSNSLYFNDATGSGGPQDIVLMFDTTQNIISTTPLSTPYTTGSLHFSQMMYIVAGKTAYFNFQAENIPAISYALEVNFDAIGGIIMSNTTTTFNCTYPAAGTWFEIAFDIDLSNNIWEVFIDGVSQGSFSNSINQIASLDLYPGISSEYYVDDVCYEYFINIPVGTYGCTDSTASNYNPSATIDDGSCQYINPGCNGRYQTEIFSSVSVTTVNYSDVYTDNAHTMDIYTPDGDTEINRPLILYMHGGSFYSGDKVMTDCVDFCESMAKRGYVTASLNYRLANVVSFITSNATQYETVIKDVFDAKSAIRYFRKDFVNGDTYGIDTNTIFVGGYSSGGVVAVHLAYIDSISDLPTSPVNVQTIVNNVGGVYGLEGDAGNYGYSSDVSGVISFAGGINDVNWIDASDEPLVSIQGDADLTVNYNCGPGMNNPAILTLCGSGEMHPQADAVGLLNDKLIFNGTDHLWAASGNSNPKFIQALEFTKDFLYPLLPCQSSTVYGCTDSLACNYDSLATINDSSCTVIDVGVIPSASILSVICNGDQSDSVTVMATGGTGFATYKYNIPGVFPIPQWNNVYYGIYPGTYPLVAVDLDGCSDTTDFTISEPDTIYAELDFDDVDCHSDSTGIVWVDSVSGGTAPYTYTWVNSTLDTISQSDSVINLIAGNYTVTITDVYNCDPLSVSVTISQPTPIASTTTIINHSSCAGSQTAADGEAQVLASQGTPGYSYSWAGPILPAYPLGYTGTGTHNTLLWPGSYIITIVDDTGCIHYDTAIIDPGVNPILDPAIVNISCYGADDGTITTGAVSGTPPYLFSYDGFATPGVPFGNVTGPTGPIGLYMTVVDAEGCTDSDSVFVVEPSLIMWQQSFSICDGDNVIVGNSIYDTTGNYIDTLTTSNGCDSIVYTNIIVDYNTSSYDTLSVTASIVWNGLPLSISGDYFVILVNSAGCDSIVNLNLTVNTTGILDISIDKRTLIKIANMLGQETPYRKNTPLFYIYNDGTVEKKIIIE